MLILGCLSYSFAWAGPQPSDSNPVKNLTLEQLGNIEVTTASKEPEEVWKTPAAIYVITQEEIRRSGYVTIPDILRLAPGVEVAKIDSSKWSVGIRGFGSRLSKSVLVLIDGRSVYTPLFRGVYWEAQDVFIEDIDRIEVIRGPGGTIWGSNAVNGIINIITKSAKDTKGTVVSAGGGNVEQGFLDARYGATSGNLSYRVYAKGFTRGPQFHNDQHEWDDWRRGQFGFRTDWDASKSDSLTIQGDVYHSAVGQTLGVSYFTPPVMLTPQANIDLSGGNVLGRWRHTFSEKSDIQVQAYYDRTYRSDLNFKEIRNTFDLDFIHHWHDSRHDVIWGAGAHVSPSDFTQVVPTVDFEPHEQTYSIYSGFLQDEVTLIQKHLSLQLGGKVEHNSFSGFDFQPSARLLWTPTDHETFWAAVTRPVRTPSQIEENFQFNALAVPALPLYLRLIGDSQFSQEKMLGYELGYRQLFGKHFYLDAATFYNEYDDLLSVENRPAVVEATPVPVHLVLPIYLRNGIEGETYGFELAPVWQLKSWWQLKGNYSYLRLDVRRKSWSDDASTVNQLEGDSPRHQVSFQSMVNLPKNFELDFTYRYVGRLPGSDQKVRAYSTADARLGWRLHKNFDLSFVGQNLFQPHHGEFNGDPGGIVEIRRSAYAKITFTR